MVQRLNSLAFICGPRYHRGPMHLRAILFKYMECEFCQSKNLQLLKEGEFNTGSFCNDCGNWKMDYHSGTCCGNQHLIDIRFEQVNKTIVQRVACKNCKTLIGGAKKKSEGFNKLQLLTQARYLEIQEIKTSGHKKLHEHLSKLAAKFRIAQLNSRREFYTSHLKSDAWKHKRQQVLERENFMCQGCHYSKAIHVHHTTYENLGDELLFQLVALCVQCHSKLHPEKFIS